MGLRSYLCPVAFLVVPLLGVGSLAAGCGGRLNLGDPPGATEPRGDASSGSDGNVDEKPAIDTDHPEVMTMTGDAVAPGMDAPPTDGSPGEATTPPSCFAGAAFPSPPPWRPPTPLHQGACSSAELSEYQACWTASSCSSGNPACDACLQTDVSSAAYGPVITGTLYFDVNDVFVNWGGCQANIDGDKVAGSCGNQTNDWQTCADLECPQSCGVDSNSCVDYAGTHQCASDTESVDCSDEWTPADSGVPLCANFDTLTNLWCGP
jgi:hypothetical protein